MSKNIKDNKQIQMNIIKNISEKLKEGIDEIVNNFSTFQENIVELKNKTKETDELKHQINNLTERITILENKS